MHYKCSRHNKEYEFLKCRHIVAIVLLWKYCHSHSFSRVNFQACALNFRSPPFPIRRSNQGIYLVVTLFVSAILNFLEINTVMDANFFLPSLLLVLSLLGTSFAKCPPSEYSAPSGTVRYSGFTDNNELNCTFNIRVPVGLRAVLAIKKLKVMGRMPNCENGSLEIRVG